MKQLLQDLTKGYTNIVEAPTPQVLHGNLLINSSLSLISAGTERMLVDFGRASYLNKARQKPEKVKMVLEKVQVNGMLSTIDAVRSKLAQPIPLGYSNVGVVSKIGQGVEGFKTGDRVVSNGRHADVVVVPKNLCARIPDSVDDESAAFTMVASIALQGIRLVQPTLGEAVVVTGAGLIGLLTVQLLRAQGCRVLAIDFDNTKLELARRFGAEICNPNKGEDPVAAGMMFSRGKGVDAVIITASTKSATPVTQAARMSRKRGRIVLVGVAGLELNRADFYEKELSFQVSCSYGPGRYDPNYEDRGLDYPLGFIRWTEQRNFEAVLELMANQQLNVKPLISHRFAFEDAAQAYDILSSGGHTLGILLEYANQLPVHHMRQVPLVEDVRFDAQKPIVSFVGAGNYASRVLIPAFKDAGAQFHTLVTLGGTNSVIHGKKAGFSKASTDTVIKALTNGKHVFVEKPLATTREELAQVEQAYQAAHENGSGPYFMVGFNRRFSPHVKKIKGLLAAVSEPKTFVMTMNAGAIPGDHWTQDLEVGGGRIIGEACHYIDLMRYLAGSEVISIQARCMGNAPGMDIVEDKAVIILGFADGSFGTIHYLANGNKAFPKERVEVFTTGRVLQLDNFRKLRGYGWPGFRNMNLWRQDKGQRACPAAFLAAIEKGRANPIPVEEIFEVARVTLDVVEQLRKQ
jgi:threonine dehydrogenase-like Zn-dependent dehydrogenase/predicted dehydrogenase